MDNYHPQHGPVWLIGIISLLSIIYFAAIHAHVTKRAKAAAPKRSFAEFCLYWRNVFLLSFSFSVCIFWLCLSLGMLVGNVLFSIVSC